MNGLCGQLYHNGANSLANQEPFVERAASRVSRGREVRRGTGPAVGADGWGIDPQVLLE